VCTWEKLIWRCAAAERLFFKTHTQPHQRRALFKRIILSRIEQEEFPPAAAKAKCFPEKLFSEPVKEVFVDNTFNWIY